MSSEKVLLGLENPAYQKADHLNPIINQRCRLIEKGHIPKAQSMPDREFLLLCPDYLFPAKENQLAFISPNALFLKNYSSV